MTRRILLGATLTVMALSGGWLARSLASQAEHPVLHVVLFQMKRGAPAMAQAELIRDAHQLLKQIPVVQELHVGRRAPGEREVHVKDYQVGLYIRFGKADDVSTYLEHPKHVKFVERHGMNIKRVRVCDFYSQ